MGGHVRAEYATRRQSEPSEIQKTQAGTEKTAIKTKPRFEPPTRFNREDPEGMKNPPLKGLGTIRLGCGSFVTTPGVEETMG
jgi:hypothetical protein